MKNLEYLITTVDASAIDLKAEGELITRSLASLRDEGRNQIIITIEELSELTQAILAMYDKTSENILNLTEEVADVELCLRYVAFVFEFDESRAHKVEVFDNLRDVLNALAKLSQSLTKHLRDKTNRELTLSLYYKVMDSLEFVISHFNINTDDIIKIRKLKDNRLRDILAEGEGYR